MYPVRGERGLPQASVSLQTSLVQVQLPNLTMLRPLTPCCVSPSLQKGMTEAKASGAASACLPGHICQVLTLTESPWSFHKPWLKLLQQRTVCVARGGCDSLGTGQVGCSSAQQAGRGSQARGLPVPDPRCSFPDRVPPVPRLLHAMNASEGGYMSGSVRVRVSEGLLLPAAGGGGACGTVCVVWQPWAVRWGELQLLQASCGLCGTGGQAGGTRCKVSACRSCVPQTSAL